MLKELVVVGNHYIVKVASGLTVVRIMREHQGYGRQRKAWIGQNLKTGREIFIKSAAKLRREATNEEVKQAKGEEAKAGDGGRSETIEPLGALLESFIVAEDMTSKLMQFKEELRVSNAISLQGPQVLLACSIVLHATRRWSKGVEEALKVLRPLVYSAPTANDPPREPGQIRLYHGSEEAARAEQDPLE
jgi:hypothetical protein